MITHITVEDAAKLISRLTNANEMQALTYIREAADRGEIQTTDGLEKLQSERDRYKSHVERLLSLPDCNTCDSKDRCAYCPDIGAFTRINCPLWRGPQEE